MPESYSGVAVNPLTGDVYAVAAVKQEIDTFDPNSGALLSSFPVPGSGNAFFGSRTWVQIAADAVGDVYLPNAPNDEIQVYSAGGTLLRTITGSGSTALKGPTGVAIEPSGNVWVADTGDNRIEEFNSLGTFLAEVKSEGVQAVAVDAHDNVFALVRNKQDSCGVLKSPCYHLVEYDSAGAALADVGAGSIGNFAVPLPEFGAITTVAVNDSNDHVYVVDGGNNLVWMYGPPSAPTVSNEIAVETTASGTKLGALIGPGGLDTSYRFEYGTTTEYAQAAPIPEGSVGSGLSPRTVWAAASELQPGTTYHYRVVATNALGTVVGADETFTMQIPAEETCPNEQFRGGFSVSLPDCRAYELVSPSQTDSGEPEVKFSSTQGDVTVAAADGERIAYLSLSSFPGSQTAGESYLATRGASGWSSENLIPPQSGYYGWECPSSGVAMPAFSADLSSSVLLDGRNQQEVQENNETTIGNGFNEGPCGTDSPELVRGEPAGVANLFVRDNGSGSYQLVNVTPPGVTPASAHFDAASSDLSHVVFDEHAQLTGNAAGGYDDLYEWSDGVVRLVTVLPNGAAAVGSLAASTGGAHAHVISSDGSRVFFTSGGKLYVRENADQPSSEECADPANACTVQVDASQVGGSGGGGQFMEASADGSTVFFLDDASTHLTADTVAGSGTNLYEYDAESGVLSDLTSAGTAEVKGVSGISEDGSYVYFVAEGVLAGNENANKETAGGGKSNLYVHVGGKTMFIAVLASEGNDNCVLEQCALVSGGGRFFAFTSLESLTGYNNIDTNTHHRDQEVFLYDAGRQGLVCASCEPSGGAPTAGAALENALTAQTGNRPRYLDDSGRLFFETAEPLLPADTNGQTDVYEYEASRLHLISSGTSEAESVLLDASESGDDAFFLTRQQLLPDGPGGEVFAIYDARVDGGFPEAVSPPPCATADACRAAALAQTPIFGAPASATFNGTENIAPSTASKLAPKSKPKPKKCGRGFVKRGNKCVRTKAGRRVAKGSARVKKEGR